MTWFQKLMEQHGEVEALAIWRRANDEWYASHPQRRLDVDELTEIESRQLGRPTFDEYRWI